MLTSSGASTGHKERGSHKEGGTADTAACQPGDGHTPPPPPPPPPPPDLAERQAAEDSLKVFSQSLETVPQSQLVLRQSASPYAQMMAASALLALITEQPTTVAMKAELRGFLLDVLFGRGPSLEPWVAMKVYTLFARLTKLGWYEDDLHRGVYDDAIKFVDSASEPHVLVGLRLLLAVVEGANHTTPSMSLSEHRKVAVSFRDQCLLKIFTLTVTSLRSLRANSTTPSAHLQEALLLLAQSCLSFDFVGTCHDESGEDVGAIQVPSSWRSLLEDGSLVRLIFDVYKSSEPPQSVIALDCLVRLASVRRSIFTGEKQRLDFIGGLLDGTLAILVEQTGLSDQDNYHSLCRLLGRLKTNYQLNEIVAIDCYPQWVGLVAKLTVSSLQQWQWAQSSVLYLMSLWSRLVSSVPYLRGDRPSLLENFVPDIVEAYLRSRLASVDAVAGGAQGVEDPLESQDQLSDQMDALPYLCRFRYEQTADYLQSVIAPLAQQWEAAAQQGLPPDQAAALEGRLTWIFLVMGAIIKGRLSSSSAELQEPLDGTLSAMVLALLPSFDRGFHSSRQNALSRQRLDSAVVSFFQSFRKVYVGEQSMHSSRIYVTLGERLGLENHLAVLQVMLDRIAKNLQNHRSCETVIGQTLELFQDLSDGYMSGKLLLKLEGVDFLLSHHTSEHFGFLTHPVNTRLRTLYYSTLARLLFLDDSPAKFRSFILPIHQLLRLIDSEGPTPALLRQKVPAETVIGLFRDLRGIVSATNSRRTYAMIFDWLHPRRFPVIHRCLEAFADRPDVTTPLLKFTAEFALNKTQRLTFDASSANGILLFRDLSKIVCTYGRETLGKQQMAPVDVYAGRYKGLWICLAILTRALSGNYANFGVFALYRDPALSDALSTLLEHSVAVPLRDILAYRKLARAYFAFLEVLCNSHTRTVAAVSPAVFLRLMSSIEAGLTSLDVAISSQCAAAVDNLVTFYLDAARQSDGVVDPSETETPVEASQLGAQFREAPAVLPQILKTLLEAVLFEDVPNQWSLSRPILPLVLLNKSSFVEVGEAVVLAQRAERQPALREALSKLLDGVGDSLEPKNRDRVTQNLALLRHTMRSQRTSATPSLVHTQGLPHPGS